MAAHSDLEFINAVDPHRSTQPSQIGTQGSGSAGGVGALIRASHHPVAAVFHYAFKAGAILVYMFGGLFSSNFVLICVATILLLAFDFWTVKNITGRLMVGLRWWSHVKEDGTNSWVFESLENSAALSAADNKLFWLGLYAAPAMWAVLFIIGVLKFNIQWLIIDAVAIVLSTANIVGYNKCSKDSKNKVRGFMQEGAMAAMGNATVRNVMLSVFAGSGTANTATSNSSSTGQPFSPQQGHATMV